MSARPEFTRWRWRGDRIASMFRQRRAVRDHIRAAEYPSARAMMIRARAAGERTAAGKRVAIMTGMWLSAVRAGWRPSA